MYTIESEVAGLDMMKTKSSLERLYNKVLQDCKLNLILIHNIWYYILSAH